MITLPRHVFHNDCIYRTMGRAHDDGLLGVGFSLKAGGDDGRGNGLRHYSLSWCLRGHGVFDDGVIRQEVQPGTLFHRFPGRPHRLELAHDGRWAECWLALGPDAFRLLSSYRVLDGDHAVTALALDAGVVDAIRRQRDALRAAHDHELPLHLTRILALVVNLLVSARSQGMDPAGTTIDLACQRITAEPGVDLHLLARDSGMSYERFRKVFRERTGLAPGEYRIQRRLERARMLLRNGDASITAIAIELGYSSAFAFSNQFKGQVGQSPSSYRQER